MEPFSPCKRLGCQAYKYAWQPDGDWLEVGKETHINKIWSQGKRLLSCGKPSNQNNYSRLCNLGDFKVNPMELNLGVSMGRGPLHKEPLKKNIHLIEKKLNRIHTYFL